MAVHRWQYMWCLATVTAELVTLKNQEEALEKQLGNHRKYIWWSRTASRDGQQTASWSACSYGIDLPFVQFLWHWSAICSAHVHCVLSPSKLDTSIQKWCLETTSNNCTVIECQCEQGTVWMCVNDRVNKKVLFWWVDLKENPDGWSIWIINAV